MILRVIVFASLLLSLTSCASGLTCLCKSNVHSVTLIHCFTDVQCSGEDVVCMTTRTYHQSTEIVLSRCLSRVQNQNWEDICSTTISRCCFTDNCNEAFHYNLSVFDHPNPFAKESVSTASLQSNLTSVSQAMPSEGMETTTDLADKTGDTDVEESGSRTPPSNLDDVYSTQTEPRAMTTVLADTPGDLNLEVSGSRTPPSNPDAVNKPLDSTQQDDLRSPVIVTAAVCIVILFVAVITILGIAVLAYYFILRKRRVCTKKQGERAAVHPSLGPINSRSKFVPSSDSSNFFTPSDIIASQGIAV